MYTISLRSSLEGIKYNAKFIATLDQKYQDKYAAINTAMDILTKAKVESYLFSYVPHFSSSKEESMVQYNNLIELAEKEKGDPAAQARIRLGKINDSLIVGFSSLWFGIMSLQGKRPSFDALFTLIGETWNEYFKKVKSN